MFDYDQSSKCDVLILTALQVECDAVLEHLSACQELLHPQGTIYQRGIFAGHDGVWQVSVAEIGLGGPGAAIETERALHFFRPWITFFVGVADGLREVQPGDVVAATKVYSYETGNAGTRFAARPEVWRSSYTLEQRARAEARSSVWLARLNGETLDTAPRVFIGALAAGEKVIVSKHSGVYQILRSTYADALAVETEGHGFLQAVRANQATQALVVRGITRLIGERTEVGRDRSRQAASHAAAFAFGVLAKLIGSRQSERGVMASCPTSEPARGSKAPYAARKTSPDAPAASTFGKDLLPAQRKVFISYSQKDTRWLARLQVHLAPFEQEGVLDLWDDTKIAAGSLWETALLEALETAQVAVPLVSADFLASPFLVQYELPKLLMRASSGGLVILPIIVSPCLFTNSELSIFQAANNPQKPLSAMSASERERTLMKVAKVIGERLMERSDHTLSSGPRSSEEQMLTPISGV